MKKINPRFMLATFIIADIVFVVTSLVLLFETNDCWFVFSALIGLFYLWCEVDCLRQMNAKQ